MNLNSLINIAVEEAKKSEFRIQVGCVIYDKKKILSLGHNEMRNFRKLHPKFQSWVGSVHAEIAAIINARKDLRGSSLLVVRVNSKNQLRLSKPCENCQKYIDYVGIKKVYYSISEYPYIIEMEEDNVLV